ncbi:MAG: hypothetical protein AB7O86_05870 [Porticoccaceae bacterium]
MAKNRNRTNGTEQGTEQEDGTEPTTANVTEQGTEPTTTEQEDGTEPTTTEQEDGTEPTTTEQEDGTEPTTTDADDAAIAAAEHADRVTLADAVRQAIDAAAANGGAVTPTEQGIVSAAIRDARALAFADARTFAEQTARDSFLAAASDGRMAHSLAGGMLAGWLSASRPSDTKVATERAARVVDPVPAALAATARAHALDLVARRALAASRSARTERGALVAALTAEQCERLATEVDALNMPAADADADTVTAFVRSHSRATKARGTAASTDDGPRVRVSHARDLAALGSLSGLAYKVRGETVGTFTLSGGMLTNVATGETFDSPTRAAQSARGEGSAAVNGWAAIRDAAGTSLADLHDAVPATVPAASPAASTEQTATV